MTQDVWPGESIRPLSYNSWLYALANPVNLTDPFGNCLDEDMDGECDPGWLCELIPNPEAYKECIEARCASNPPQAPPVSPGFIEPLANQVYNTYLALRDHNGWWHNDEDVKGKFTPHDMLEVLLSIEFNGVASEIAHFYEKEIAVRNFYAICGYRGGWCDSKEEKNAIEFIAAKLLIHARAWVVPKGADPTGIWGFPLVKLSTADFSAGFKNPGGWRSGVGDLTVPYDWGNLSMFIERFPGDLTRYREAYAAEGGDIGSEGNFVKENVFYYKLPPRGDPNAFIVLNRLQTLYWYKQ